MLLYNLDALNGLCNDTCLMYADAPLVWSKLNFYGSSRRIRVLHPRIVLASKQSGITYNVRQKQLPVRSRGRGKKDIADKTTKE